MAPINIQKSGEKLKYFKNMDFYQKLSGVSLESLLNSPQTPQSSSVQRSPF